MQTNVIDDVTLHTPYLLPAQDLGGGLEPIALVHFPFTIGRNAACSYQIASSRISREHATLLKDSKGFRLKDLGSTNGTLVNGQKISETRLVAGDVIALADMQFTFCLPQPSAAPGGATLVLSEIPNVEPAAEDAQALALVTSLRRLQEALLCRAAPVRYEPLVEFASGKVIGREALFSGPWGSGSDENLPVDSRMAERARLLYRILAAEQAAHGGEGALLVLGLRHEEVGADLVPETLSRLVRQALPRELIVGVPHAAAVDTPYFHSFVERLRALGLGVALANFAGGARQLFELAPIEPYLVQLAPAMVRGIDRSSQRQRQLKDLVAAAEAINTRLSATGVHSQNDANVCRDLGCRLGQGEFFAAVPAASPLDGLYRV